MPSPTPLLTPANSCGSNLGMGRSKHYNSRPSLTPVKLPVRGNYHPERPTRIHITSQGGKLNPSALSVNWFRTGNWSLFTARNQQTSQATVWSVHFSLGILSMKPFPDPRSDPIHNQMVHPYSNSHVLPPRKNPALLGSKISVDVLYGKAFSDPCASSISNNSDIAETGMKLLRPDKWSKFGTN